MCDTFIFEYIVLAFGFIDRTAEYLDRKQDERERGGGTHSKETKAGSQTRVREDRASVHGTPALPTELNNDPWYIF